LYSYRAHTLANKGDLKSALVDTEKVLKLKKGDADAQALRTWIETRLKNQNAPGSTPAPPPQPTRGR
jgi:major membrane immunogen (membrane-anchored lipoprotein)